MLSATMVYVQKGTVETLHLNTSIIFAGTPTAASKTAGPTTTAARKTAGPTTTTWTTAAQSSTQP